MCKATDQRDAQTISLLWTCLLLFHGGDVTCFDACHVIWCGGHVIWCDVIACVVSCHVMQCDVLWCALMWCALQWSRCVFEVVLWQVCTTRYYSSTTLYYKVLLQYYSVLHSTTTYYSSTTLYCKVLLQYYPVLQSTTPVLLCTAKCYSSTTLYYKVLLQYYSVLQSTTPVLLCTTKCYSSTTLYYTTQYYNVLLQYYPVLQSTTPVLLCTGACCTAKYYSSTSLHYKVLLQYYSVLHSTTTYYSSTTLYYKAAFIIDPWHIWTVIYLIDVRRIWNVIYNARSNRSHPPTSPNTAPATKNGSHDWCPSHMKRHLQCAEQQASPSNLTKYCACHVTWLSWLILVTYETSFTMRGATGITLHLTKYSACHEKWCASSVVVTVETSFTMRGATGITLQPHQILRLPRKTMRIIDPRHIWNVIYNARSNKHHPPTSPNTAPATQNDSHDWCPSHMKRHLQCAEQQASPSNLTKYCACHAKLHSKILEKLSENSWSVIYNARPIRAWSEHDPSMIRPWTRHLAPARSRRLHFVLRRRILYWKLQHFALRLSTQISPNTAPV